MFITRTTPEYSNIDVCIVHTAVGKDEAEGTGRSDYGTVDPSDDHDSASASTADASEKRRHALQVEGVTWADVVRRTNIAGKPSTIAKKRTNVHTTGSKVFREIILSKQSTNE